MIKRFISLFILSFLWVSFVFTVDTNKEQKVKVGAIIPLSGDLASLGRKLQDGMVDVQVHVTKIMDGVIGMQQ